MPYTPLTAFAQQTSLTVYDADMFNCSRHDRSN